MGGTHNNHRVLQGSKIRKVGLKSVPTCHGRAEASLHMYSHGAVNGCCQVTGGSFHATPAADVAELLGGGGGRGGEGERKGRVGCRQYSQQS